MRRTLVLTLAALALALIVSRESVGGVSIDMDQEASLQLGYDDNVTKSYVESVSDGVARLAYGLVLRPSLFKNASLNAGYGLGIKKYLSVLERDTIIHRGTLNFEFSSERVFGGFSTEARYRSIRSGLRNYRWWHAGSFIGFRVQRDTSIIGSVELAALDFEGSSYFDYWAQAYGARLVHNPRPVLFEMSLQVEDRNYSRPAYDAEFSGDEIFLILSDRARHDVRTSLGARVGWRNGFLINALYRTTVNRSNSYGREFVEHAIGVEGSLPFVWDTNIHARALLKLREHTQKTLLPQSSYLEEEEEGLSEMGLSITRPLSNSVRLELGYQRFWMAYRYHSLRYQKDIATVGVAVRF